MAGSATGLVRGFHNTHIGSRPAGNTGHDSASPGCIPVIKVFDKPYQIHY